MEQRRRRFHRDDGTTLIELLVGMTLMAVFLAMFTGAIVMMSSAMNKTQAVNLSATQINLAFVKLDELVRPSSAISPPGPGRSRDWYTELRTTTSGTEVCSQLRLDSTSQQLQIRTWDVVNATASRPSSWVPLASGITSEGVPSGPPFSLVPTQDNVALQQLTFSLSSAAGAGASMTTSTSSFTLTALNSTLPTPAGPICQQQGRP